MKKIEYKKLKKEDLKSKSKLFIFDNGHRIIMEINNEIVKIKLNDELLEEPFSKKDIQLLKSSFQIKKPVIENSWKESENPPFHDNYLAFEMVYDKDQLYSLVQFVFEKLYKIND